MTSRIDIRRPGRQSPLPGELLTRSFFEDPPEQVAPRLLGKILAHKTDAGVLAGRIVEVEAYLGPHNDPPDPAAHSYRGTTPRNSVLFGPAGHAYVYAIYGRYFCMNISCEVEGQAGCVLLRALEPLESPDPLEPLDPLAGPDNTALAQMARNRGLAIDGTLSGKMACRLTSGPSRLCQALGLTRPVHNGLDLTSPNSPLQVRDDGCTVTAAMVSARIGISEAVDWPLRFTLPGHPCVSGPRRFSGTRVLLR